MTKLKLILLLFFFMFLLVINDDFSNKCLNRYQCAPVRASKIVDDYETTFIPSYESSLLEPDLDSLQCPIPIENRIKNYTGIQCVYASIETLGRWAEEPKLINPPITSRSDCKGYSNPSSAAKILNKLNVKFEQTYGDKKSGVELIKKSMSQGRGCLWGVPGHAMVIIHYNEKENKVCWVDNSDYKLRVQQTTIDKFNQRWNTWVLVIYADADIVGYKANKNLNLPIIDQNDKNKIYPRNYIPIPTTILRYGCFNNSSNM